MRTYSVLFDKNYLANFILLFNSLEKNDNTNFVLNAFCMDESSYKYLILEFQSNSKINIINLNVLLNYFPTLNKIKENRSLVEFYFTCSPFICRYTLDMYPKCTYNTYLDADIYFFGNVDIIYEEISNNSILIFKHNFYGYGKKFLKYGNYNVGWITFKNNFDGNECLNNWKNNCNDWCFDYYDNIGDRFADQKYLDKWDALYDSVKISNNIATNIGPWSIGQYKISKTNQKIIYINNHQLIFYHFASFKNVFGNIYTTNISSYFSRPNSIIKNDIYLPYISELSHILDIINKKNIINKIDLLNKNRKYVKKYIFNFREIYYLLLKFILQDFIFFKNK